MRPIFSVLFLSMLVFGCRRPSASQAEYNVALEALQNERALLTELQELLAATTKSTAYKYEREFLAEQDDLLSDEQSSALHRSAQRKIDAGDFAGAQQDTRKLHNDLEKITRYTKQFNAGLADPQSDIYKELTARITATGVHARIAQQKKQVARAQEAVDRAKVKIEK